MALRPEDLPVGQCLEQFSVWSNPADRLPFGFHCDASDEIFQRRYCLLAGQCKAIDRTRVQRRKHLVATSVDEGCHQLLLDGLTAHRQCFKPGNCRNRFPVDLGPGFYRCQPHTKTRERSWSCANGVTIELR